jgi:hypothetical protein
MGELCIWLDTRVGILGDQLLGPVVLPNRLTGAVSHRLFGELFSSTLGTCASSSMTTHGFMHNGAPPHFFRTVRQQMKQTFGEQWVDRTRRLSKLAVKSPDRNPPDFWLWGHPKNFDVFSADHWLKDIRANSRECLPGDSSETRNFRKIAHLCATKSLKLCWNTWEPQRSFAVVITRTSPISQQALVSGHMSTGTFLLNLASTISP